MEWSQCPKDQYKKTKGKNRKKDEENDVGKGNNGSFSFNTERDIMSQDNKTEFMQKYARKEMTMKGRLTNGRLQIKWIRWMNAIQVKNECVKMKRNVRRNMDQMK